MPALRRRRQSHGSDDDEDGQDGNQLVPVVAETARLMRTPTDVAKSNAVCADAVLAKYEAASQTE
jgi:hypothetical protein